MKLELLTGRRHRTREAAKAAIFEWIEGSTTGFVVTPRSASSALRSSRGGTLRNWSLCLTVPCPRERVKLLILVSFGRSGADGSCAGP